jgi:hypothetical protein
LRTRFEKVTKEVCIDAMLFHLVQEVDVSGERILVAVRPPMTFQVLKILVVACLAATETFCIVDDSIHCVVFSIVFWFEAFMVNLLSAFAQY